MNTSVLLFFIHNVLATLLLGGKFATRPNPVFKNFGFALLIEAVAFAIWSAAVILRPENLEQYVSIGTAVLIVSLLFLLAAGTQNLSSAKRWILLVVGAIVGAGIFYTGSLTAYPSLPGFSPEGFFFFNVHPLLQVLYILALALTAFPAIDAVASKFNGIYAVLVRYGFIIEVAGGIVLITAMSTNVSAPALYLVGWVIGIVYFALWATLLFNRKAWSSAS